MPTLSAFLADSHICWSPMPALQCRTRALPAAHSISQRAMFLSCDARSMPTVSMVTMMDEVGMRMKQARI